jgi:hypothetical protein
MGLRSPQTNPNRSTTLSFVIPTGRSGVGGSAVLRTGNQCKPKQPLSDLSSRPERSEVEGPAVPSATNQSEPKQPVLDLSSRPQRSEVEGSAVPSATNQSQSKQLPSDLSSRPKRSEVEGPAVPPPPQTNLNRSNCPQICHPDRSVAKWRDLQFPPATNQSQPKQPLSDLSSRPERSEVEGPAVPPRHKPISTEATTLRFVIPTGA